MSSQRHRLTCGTSSASAAHPAPKSCEDDDAHTVAIYATATRDGSYRTLPLKREGPWYGREVPALKLESADGTKKVRRRRRDARTRKLHRAVSVPGGRATYFNGATRVSTLSTRTDRFHTFQTPNTQARRASSIPRDPPELGPQSSSLSTGFSRVPSFHFCFFLPGAGASNLRFGHQTLRESLSGSISHCSGQKRQPQASCCAAPSTAKRVHCPAACFSANSFLEMCFWHTDMQEPQVALLYASFIHAGESSFSSAAYSAKLSLWSPSLSALSKTRRVVASCVERVSRN